LKHEKAETEIYPEIFSPDVNKLRKEETPVEGQLGDVVPPGVDVRKTVLLRRR